MLDLARRVRPDLDDRLGFSGTAAVREEIGRVIPFYDGIQRLRQGGDQFQYGGPHLCADWKFPTPDGKAHFTPVTPPKPRLSEGTFLVATRRGRQFNSMIYSQRDGVTGADRDSIFINAADAERLGLRQGDQLLLRNEVGEYRGRAFMASVAPGTLQVHWPEAEVIIDRRRRSPQAGIPDYNAEVTIDKVEGREAVTIGRE